MDENPYHPPMEDNWGTPIPATAFSGHETRKASIAELSERAAAAKTVSLQSQIAALIANYREGDMLLWYNSPKADWAAGMGSAGYVLIRGEWVLDSIVLKMN